MTSTRGDQGHHVGGQSIGSDHKPEVIRAIMLKGSPQAVESQWKVSCGVVALVVESEQPQVLSRRSPRHLAAARPAAAGAAAAAALRAEDAGHHAPKILRRSVPPQRRHPMMASTASTAAAAAAAAAAYGNAVERQWEVKIRQHKGRGEERQWKATAAAAAAAAAQGGVGGQNRDWVRSGRAATARANRPCRAS